MNQTAPAPTDKKMTLRDRLERMTPEFKKALPNHISVEKFVRTIQTAVQSNSQVAKVCDTPDGAQSLFASCTRAAADGLILDGREAVLVTFRCKVDDNKWEDRIQYQPMVAGLMKKARNSGQISSIAAHMVYANDEFSYILGDDERIEHKPKMGDRGAPIAVYAIVRLKDGSVQREVMDKAAVMAIAKQSKNANQYNPDTGANYGEWWRKTVIRRISKYLPSSSDRDEFLQAVERLDDGFDFEASNGGPTTPTPHATVKVRGAGAAKLKDVVTQQRPPEPQKDHDANTGEIYDDERFAQPGDDI